MLFTNYATYGMALAALATPVLSTIVVTSPVASTSGSGGKKLDIEWNDDGKAPKVDKDAWGRVSIYLATGSTNTQYKLETLASNLSPSTTSYQAMIPADAGPNSNKYFLRFEGSKQDSKGYPVMAFSARFSLDSMKGTFNSTIQQTNAGASDAPSGPTAAAGMTSTRMSSTTSSTATSSTASLGVSTRPTNTSSAATDALPRLTVAISVLTAGLALGAAAI